MGNNKLGSVCWEVSRAGGIHTHWQWMPIAAEMAQKGLVEAACKVQAQNEGWDVKWEKVVLEDGSGELVSFLFYGTPPGLFHV